MKSKNLMDQLWFWCRGHLFIFNLIHFRFIFHHSSCWVGPSFTVTSDSSHEILSHGKFKNRCKDKCIASYHPDINHFHVWYFWHSPAEGLTQSLYQSFTVCPLTGRMRLCSSISWSRTLTERKVVTPRATLAGAIVSLIQKPNQEIKTHIAAGKNAQIK